MYCFSNLTLSYKENKTIDTDNFMTFEVVITVFAIVLGHSFNKGVDIFNRLNRISSVF